MTNFYLLTSYYSQHKIPAVYLLISPPVCCSLALFFEDFLADLCKSWLEKHHDERPEIAHNLPNPESLQKYIPRVLQVKRREKH